MAAEDVCMEFLDEAFRLAEEALENNEVPVGCVFVYKGKIIGRGRNDVNRTKNPTRHAEMVAFDELREWCEKEAKPLEEVLSETVLYVSLEPCIMCGSAMYQLKIKRIVYGASNKRFGGIDSVAGKDKYAADHDIQIVRGIMKDRAIQLLKDFYDRQNPFAPPEKRKMDSKAEKLAAEYEQGQLDPTKNNGGKRTKSEQVDHKHPHPEGDTRKMVNTAMNGEQKRKEQTK